MGMTEFTPPWSTPQMTKAQMRKYLADMKAAQEAAKKKLPDEQKLHIEREKEIKKIEAELDDVY